ncbi:hypothetical protein K7I13_01340 [Brucepastera parasyntrophica]|uniref:hypothetical protein n=1 Tax=Brucepastera parasyntrophica TaxID=2880008 RepID=UPI00210E3D88|nr:hypothetical protein [Brucepastera parasyntrophica]ULQ60007.1 hypothetical protein K7I13_01340 [Brucepastera parasyntrophica]
MIGSYSGYLVFADSLLDKNREKKITVQSSEFADLLRLLHNPETSQLIPDPPAVFKKADAVRWSQVNNELSGGKQAVLVTVSFSSLFFAHDKIQMEPEKLIIYEAIVRRIARRLGPANILTADRNGTLHIAIFSTLDTDINLYFESIISSLTKLYGDYRISHIDIQKIKTASTAAEVMVFLDGDF